MEVRVAGSSRAGRRIVVTGSRSAIGSAPRAAGTAVATLAWTLLLDASGAAATRSWQEVFAGEPDTVFFIGASGAVSHSIASPRSG